MEYDKNVEVYQKLKGTFKYGDWVLIEGGNLIGTSSNKDELVDKADGDCYIQRVGFENEVITILTPIIYN